MSAMPSMATESVRRNEQTRMGWTGRAPAPNRSEDDRGLRSTRSASLCPIRQPLQSFTPLASNVNDPDSVIHAEVCELDGGDGETV